MAAARSQEVRPHREELLALAGAVDPDPLRNRLRAVLAGGDPAALKELAASEEVTRLGPGPLYLLGRTLSNAGARQDAAAFFRRAQQRYPGDYSLNDALGSRYRRATPPRFAEAARFYTAAVALRPENPGAHINLGVALDRLGDLDGAIRSHREAVRLSPSYTYAYNNLGSALRRNGDLEGAIQAYREGVRLRPGVVVTHLGLASALEASGALDEATAEFQETIRRAPDHFQGYAGLGQVHLRRLQFDQASEVYRLGLQKVSDRAAAAALTRELHKCRHFAELDGKLARILRGEAEPAGNAERLELARWCAEYRKLDAAAVRFFRDALARDPALAEDLRAATRYDAACAAALAGCGRGADAKDTSAAERAGLRRQALDWLRADLTAWQRVLAKEPARAAAVKQKTRHWLGDRDFAGVRGPDALGRLPEAERRDWQQLWQEVEALRQRADKP
jgi:tetratricopeptide (TPR) repeat protein